jgi:hypothetical protein
MLTEGYPTEVKTIGYFVPVEEWQRYQKGQHKGFSRYLIAQRGQTRSTQEFADLKRYVKAQQGDIADHTDLPSVFDSQGRVPLGVIDETDDSISFGFILKFAPAGGGAGASRLLACINVMMRLKGETLALYIYDSVGKATDTEGVKALTKRWLRCIRARNDARLSHT